MKLKTKAALDAKLGRVFRPSLTGLCLCAALIPLFAQTYPANQVIRSAVKQFGTAEARLLTKDSGFYPGRQPQIYWHGANWKIDLLPLSSPNAAFRLRITSENGKEQLVKLPSDYAQIDSILRASDNKAIVIANVNGMTQAFCIIDLRSAKIIDGTLMYGPSVSPNRRFILYGQWYPPHSQNFEYRYLLYDTQWTPRRNQCGYWEKNPAYKVDDQGLQVYPAQFLCAAEDYNDDNMGFDFRWAADSSKIVFADVKSQLIRLVLVKMPRDKDDLPRTLTYKFTGPDNVCAGASSCDYSNVGSVAWDGNAVKVVLIKANPTGAAIKKNVTVPLSRFVPIGPSSDPRPDSGRQAAP